MGNFYRLRQIFLRGEPQLLLLLQVISALYFRTDDTCLGILTEFLIFLCQYFKINQNYLLLSCMLCAFDLFFGKFIAPASNIRVLSVVVLV